jgi:hypothetical protein
VQPTSVPTIMRLSVLAHLIALPAAVFSAVSPLQRSTDPEVPSDFSGPDGNYGEFEARVELVHGNPHVALGGTTGVAGLPGVCITFASMHVGH